MKKYIIIILALFITSLVGLKSANAASRDLSGWAWSSNIGWVSLNSFDDFTGPNGVGTSSIKYKVVRDDYGKLTGYGWSSNIGWLKFGAYDASHPPAQMYRSGAIVGWIRACSGSADKDNCNGAGRTDGWDGWILLSDGDIGGNKFVSNPGCTDWDLTCTKGVFSLNNIINGFSWGSVNVGWLRFKAKIAPEEIVPLFIGATIWAVTPINRGTASKITWSSDNAVDCTIEQGGSPWKTPSGPNHYLDGSEYSDQLSTNTVFTITCVNGAKTATDSKTVVVNDPINKTELYIGDKANPVNSKTLNARKGTPFYLRWDITKAATDGCNLSAIRGASTVAKNILDVWEPDFNVSVINKVTTDETKEFDSTIASSLINGTYTFGVKCKLDDSTTTVKLIISSFDQGER